MEHLTKHQMILVALLVSFVTSLATGIVTVSLMDQAPQGITRTITQVIQQTVAGAVQVSGATSTAAVSIAVSDQVADATSNVTPSIVRLRDGDKGDFIGLGLIVSDTGTIMADKNLIDNMNEPQAVYYNGLAVPVAISRFQVDGEIAFMTPLRTLPIDMKPVLFGGEARLGSSVWAVSGGSSYVLNQGIVTQLENFNGVAEAVVDTSLPSSQLLSGTPLFDATGSVIGIATKTLLKKQNAAFYPISLARAAIPR